jgi:predicted short-subunit dehydrogenase-like oxidoreductase (DUF2520 family)
MRIVIIGTGNTATVLGKLILASDHDLLQVFGRSKKEASDLGNELQCSFTDDVDEIMSNGDLYIVAISDAALYSVHDWLQLKRKFVVHTAGSVPMKVLSHVSSNYGVLYPLQSLRKEMHRLPEIPFVIDGNTVEDRTLITDFARSLSPIVLQADDEHRLKMHLAAVFVSNFTNHLYTLAESFCQKQDLDFNALIPLISEVSVRLQDHSPSSMQTGPAVRKDQITIEKHLSLLNGFPDMKDVYELLSEKIIGYYQNRDHLNR